MSTQPNRTTGFTMDGNLVVGYGPHQPMKEGTVAKNYGGRGGVKQASVTFGYKLASGANVPVPAGANVVGVVLYVEDAFVGGTSLTVGDGSSATGFIDGTQGATANLTAGAALVASGAYTKGATDTGAQEFKLYASADTIDVAVNGTFTAGKATLVVSYI